MSKRVKSTFERLKSGRLSRKERKELQRRLYSEDPRSEERRVGKECRL